MESFRQLVEKLENPFESIGRLPPEVLPRIFQGRPGRKFPFIDNQGGMRREEMNQLVDRRFSTERRLLGETPEKLIVGKVSVVCARRPWVHGGYQPGLLVINLSLDEMGSQPE